MGLNRRVFFVWLISFAILLVVYVVYTRVNETPPIKINTPEHRGLDVNGLDRGGGRIGDVAVGELKDTTFHQYLNEEKTIGREFGFERWLHKQGQEWEIEKPFMNLYWPDGKCRITAETGVIEIEGEGTNIAVKEAMMTGNVVVRMTPKGAGRVKESVAYLDDILFISDRSLFSTAGPVRVENEDFRMSGRGLEFIYNMQLNRLEFLKLVFLESLYARLKTRGGSSWFGGDSNAAGDAGSGKTGSENQGGGGADSDEMYRCILRKDVTVETDKEYVFADEIVMENLLLKSDGEEESGIGDSNVVENAVAQAEESEGVAEEFEEVAISCGAGIVIEPMSAGHAETGGFADTASSKVLIALAAADDAIGERTQVIARKIEYDVLSKDCFAGGPIRVFYVENADDSNSPGRKVPVTITAENGAHFLMSEERIVFEGNCVCSAPMPDSNYERPWVLKTPKLTIDMSSSREERVPQISAGGALEFSFWANSVTGEDSSVPVKLTARDYAEFSPSLNQVVFEGDCVCTMPREEGDENDLYSLFAPRVTVALAANADEKPEAWANGPSEVQFFSKRIMGATGVPDALPVTITAANGTWFTPLLNQIVFEGNCEFSMPREDLGRDKKYTLSSPKFTVNLPDKGEEKEGRLSDKFRSLTAEGPLEVNFYVDDFIDSNSRAGALPARITAKEQGKFIPELDKVILQGDCVCVMTRESDGVQEEYRFSAPTVNVDLYRDKERGSSAGVGANVKHINAFGGTVRLSVVKKEGDKMLGGVELQCTRFDYDTAMDVFMAAGPGMIKVDNSKIEPEEGVGRFGLRKQCFALIENFETLDYFAKSGRVVAASRKGDVSFGYIPIVRGEFGEVLNGTARSIEVNLAESADDRLELASLLATGGITCRKGDDISFSGKELSYNRESSMINVRDDAQTPCFYNGGPVEGIQWNLKTDQFKFRLPGPGMF